jgi:hypothetical protein
MSDIDLTNPHPAGVAGGAAMTDYNRQNRILDFVEAEGGSQLEGLSDIVSFLRIGKDGEVVDDEIDGRRRRGRPRRIGDDERPRRSEAEEMSAAKQNLKIVDPDPVDPLRMEISIAIADRSARLEAVSEARRVVDRIKAMLEKAESKKSLASVKAEDERLAHIEFLAETAKSRPPESAPLSPARRALADACEELAAAQAAFEIAQSNRAKADADLALAVQKVDAAINALFARDLSKRIAAAQRSHDEFMAQALVFDEVAPDSANLPEATARELRLMWFAA